jgi:peptidoglycan/LPS O-acetylase OafA/YrhL
MVFLGEISYSVFVFHWILLQVMQRYPLASGIFSGGNEIFTYCFVLLAISAASFFVIEQPFRRFARIISMHFEKPSS